MVLVLSKSNVAIANSAVNTLGNIKSEHYYVNYSPKLKLHLYEKRHVQYNKKSGKVIILLNPLSLPSVKAFDVDNYSVMDELANNGFDVWGIDFIGQGSSSYPLEMQQSPPPIGLLPLRARDATKQLATAVRFILQQTEVKKLDILGWSWSSVVAAMYAIDYPQQVRHLILYGAMYSFLLPDTSQEIFVKPYLSSQASLTNRRNEFKRNLPAYQNVPWRMINGHWQMMLHGDDQIVSKDAINAVRQSYITMDPHPVILGTVRRPIGPMRDLFAIWNKNPLYDISQLTTPTMVIYGDLDIFADRELFTKLVKVKLKQEVCIENATHWLIYEKTRKQFMQTIIQFLNK